MRVEEKKIKGFNVRVISMNNLAIGIATDIGPRILYLARNDRLQENLFGIYPELGMNTDEGFWRVYGGHRLWSAPESKPRSYSIDDKPVTIKIEGEVVTVYGNPEKENFIRKEIEIRPFGENGVQIVHRIENISRWPIKLGCWGLSLMEGEGFAVIPISASKVDRERLLPDRHLSLWPYTSLEDRRLKLTNDYIFVMKDPKMNKPFKIGAEANPSWAAYVLGDIALVKEFSKIEGEYPDFGCNVEVYTNAGMLEFETLSPMKSLDPFASIEHIETWKILETGTLEPKADAIKGRLEVLLTK
ncbi:MAG: hypothetical protein ACUVQ8_04820 [Nitrososphaeria archaeon]